jgi:hypothetical protein
MNSKRQARRKVKKNPLKNIGLLSRLNPYAAVQKRQTLLTQLKGRRTGTTPESKVKLPFRFFSFINLIFCFSSGCSS